MRTARFRSAHASLILACLSVPCMLAVLHAEEPKIPRIEPNAGDLVRVPDEFSTIQAAIDAVDDGGIVLVSPGVYQESLTLGGKSITLASEFLTTGDAGKIKETVLDGTLTADDGSEEVFDALIRVEPTIGRGSKIVGFTIRNADDGIACHGSLAIIHNRFECARTGNDWFHINRRDRTGSCSSAS